MDNKEIEIKLQIDVDIYDRLLAYLKINALLEIEKHQVDTYYSPENECYYDCGDRCLRIRTEGSKSILSYKRIYDENTDKQFIEEYETFIDNPEMMDNILKALNYKCEIIVDKHRVEYSTENGFLIALDKVKDLGFFIEIENNNISDALEKRNKDLKQFIHQLEIDISQRNTEGYSNMLYRKFHKKGETD